MMAWVASSRSSNYILLNKLCDIMLATSLVRAGVRRKNYEVMLAGSKSGYDLLHETTF